MTGARFDFARFARARSTRPPRSLPPLGETSLLFSRTASTQDLARSIALQGAPHGLLVLAEEQTAGRGRRGRGWRSPAGAGIWASLVLRPRGSAADSPLLTIAGSIALCEAARVCGARAAEIKWPNDILVGERKIAGVLGEVLPESRAEAPGYVVLLGVGINVEPHPELEAAGFATPAGCLRESGLVPSCGREEVLGGFLDILEGILPAVGLDGSEEILEHWRRLSPASVGRRVTVEEEAGRPAVIGTTSGIGPDGSLGVRLDAGGVHRVRFGGTLSFLADREVRDAPRH